MMSTKAKNIVHELLDHAGITVNGDKPWDIQVHNPNFYQRVLSESSLGLGESYVEGWWDCKALDEFICRLLAANLESKVKQNLQLSIKVMMSRIFNMQSHRRAKQVADIHYNLDNNLYQYMLGPTMSYTCAYWHDAQTLNEAQEAKHDLVCNKLNLSHNDQVLELGCGWGGFAGFAAEKYDCQLTSVNISTEQIKFAKEKYKGLPINFVLSDYRDKHLYNPNNQIFDKVVSIGLCEHIGPKNYGHLFKLAHQQLKDDGLFLLHTIGGNISRSSCEPWTNKYIFPNGVLPSISQLSNAFEGLFVMEDWHNFGPDYDLTLLAWFHNFDKNWDKLKDKYDERFYRLWKYYLLSCAGMFRSRGGQLWQIVFSKGRAKTRYHSIR